MVFYNIDFDIASIFIFLVTFFAFRRRSHVDRMQRNYFLLLWIFSVLTAVLDIFASFAIEYRASFWTVQVTTLAYYMFKTGGVLCQVAYIVSMLENSDSMPRLYRILLSIPAYALMVMIALNPWTGLTFTYENNIYRTGILRNINYAVVIFYYSWIIFFVIRYQNKLKRYFTVIVSLLVAANIVVEIIQFKFPLLSLHALAISLTLLCLVINDNLYTMVVDSVTGMGRKEHLASVCTKLFEKGESFNLILVRMKDYDLNANRYGIENLEESLSEVAKFLSSQAEQGRAFHISQDAFALIYPSFLDGAELASRLYSRVHKAWKIKGMELVFEFYVSLIECPENLGDTKSVMSAVYYFSSMQRQKHGLVPFKELQVKDRMRESRVEKAIEEALMYGHFEVYYQPICTAKDQRFVTAEALLRLKDPELGFISPAEFIPIAERCGSILQVGNFVLETVCSFIETHNLDQLGLRYIEVNLSTVQVLQSNFIEIIDQVTSNHKVTSDRLCFEITETAASSAPTVFTKNLKALTERGYLLALDDFGTGYGNLQRMVSSDFKIIKFDKEMTQHLSSEDQLQKVYVTLQAMIQTMGSKIVSEGVETKEQYEFVRDAGAGYIQGYYFSKPLPEGEFIEFLKKRIGLNEKRDWGKTDQSPDLTSPESPGVLKEN